MRLDVILNTNMSVVTRLAPLAVLLCLLFSGCQNATAPRTAVLTFKSDGTHFTGTVVRRESKSITVAGPLGDSHTFLYSELSNIQYPNTDAALAGTGGSQSGGKTVQSSPSAAEAIQLPTGITIPVTNNGLIDSSFVPEGATTLAAMDADAKGPDGKVLIPAGATVTLRVREKKVVAGRVSMEFELGTVDFGNRHYMMTSAKGESEPGPILTIMGAEPRSPEAKLRGENLHLDDHSLLLFKTTAPFVLKAEQ
jgi:hypothetical protein